MDASLKQYSYNEMANKVITEKKHKSLSREEDPAMPSSLKNHISVKDFGSRALPETSPSVQPQATPAESKMQLAGYSTSYSSISYCPTTAENAHIFDLIMTMVHTKLPDATHDVILSAADTVLETIKLEGILSKEKTDQIRSIIGSPVSDTEMSDLINLADRITDFDRNTEEEENGETDPNGVAIVFDEEDEVLPNDVPALEVHELDSSAETLADDPSTVDIVSELVLSGQPSNEKPNSLIPLSSIDLFFLHRQVANLLENEDPDAILHTHTELYRLLSEKDLSTGSLENELMELFNYDNFEFIKTCVLNRWRLVYRIRYLETDLLERQTLIDEMLLLGHHELAQQLEDSMHESKKRKLENDEESSEQSTKNPKVGEASRKPKIVDLDALSFDSGARMLTNSKIKLPQGAAQQIKKSFDIITIPPPEPRPMTDSERLVQISELPAWAQQVFPSSETITLNRIQSVLYESAFKSDENLLLCAPTGAGKTNVAMLTILRAIENHRDHITGQINLKSFKVVYVAPLKALVQEQVREFQRRLTPNYGIVVNELTGDASLSKQQINETQVLVTTPEKWDVITRKESNPAVALVRLIIIDEIHLLHDTRGPVLESLVARTLRQRQESKIPVRLVGLSATLPNYRDVADFLNVDIAKGLFYFDGSYRPCPLQQEFVGIKEKKAIKKLLAMNEACYDKLVDCLDKGHQLIIFVHSRKETHKTASWLRDRLKENDKLSSMFKSGTGSSEILSQEAESMKDRSLKDIVGSGFGIHHAGLTKSERTVVEDLFAQGHLQVLVSTATLAWGVNLPAHTVVIKGTDTYSPEGGCWTQLAPQDILQMLGRAGRPRYDKSGEGVIITSHDELQYYLAILNQQLPIESQLISKLVDSVNAEIVLGSIRSREDVVSWLSYTYLYVRMLKSPSLYRVGPEYENDDRLYWKRVDLAHSALTILRENKLIEYDADHDTVQSTELGKIASHFYISYSTINMYNTQMKPWHSEIDILRIFASSEEFKYIPVRPEEKLEVKKLMDLSPIPIKDKADDPLAKVNVLLQTYVARLQLDGFALMADMTYITQSAGRLLRAIYTILLKKNWSALTKTSLELCKMIEKRSWGSNSPLRQFGSAMPPAVIKATESSYLPFISYFNLKPAELAEALNLKGNSQTAYQFLEYFPKLSLECYAQPITPTMIRVQMEIVPQWKWQYSYHGTTQKFLVLVEDCNGEKILYSDSFTVHQKDSQKVHYLDAYVTIGDPVQPVYYVSFISETWLHSEWRVPLEIEQINLPKKFPAFTELLDLQGVPVTSLKKEEFSAIFDFTYLNKFQSQVFPTLYNSNENIFIGVSKGGGKTVCAELAFLNHWRQNGGRAVYIAPCQGKLDFLHKTWSKRFLNFQDGDLTISKLTGETATDLAILGRSHLTLATPSQLHALTMRWKQRRVTQNIELLVADDAHTVGSGTLGADYEFLLTRMKFISSQLDKPMRFVVLSLPLANGRDFGEWLDCARLAIFNFDPAHRFNKVSEIRITSLDLSDHDAFVSTATSHTYKYLKEQMKVARNALLFSSSRQEGLKIGFELARKAESDDWKPSAVESDGILLLISRVNDKRLTTLLNSGIGLIYDGMHRIDLAVVKRMFGNGSISILIASRETCFYAPSAELVVMLGTELYDGREHRFIDYPINEVLEMVGCCGNADTPNSRVLMLTKSARLAFYNKFLTEGLPIESFVPQDLHNFISTEISTGNITNRQHCIDWITFTYFYRRLQQNPSFYDIKDTSHLGVSEFLSELIETVLSDLEDAKMIEVDDDEEQENETEDDTTEVTPTNGAMIAAHYNLTYHTMKSISEVDNRTKLKMILESLTSATEFTTLPMRESEDTTLKKLASVLPIQHTAPDYDSPNFKAFILLQAHFSRVTLPIDLAIDQNFVLPKMFTMVNAAIDTLGGEGHLNAVHCIDLCQMIVQGVWSRDSPLKQVPYFDEDILARCQQHNVVTVFDIMSLEDDERDKLLQLDDKKLNGVAEFVNKYPNIDISYEMDTSDPIIANEPKKLTVIMERDEDMEDLIVVAPRYPTEKKESWWIVVGDMKSRQLYAMKKTTIAKEKQQLVLDVVIPNPGNHHLSVWCMCDSYVDADKEITFDVEVVAAADAVGVE